MIGSGERCIVSQTSILTESHLSRKNMGGKPWGPDDLKGFGEKIADLIASFVKGRLRILRCSSFKVGRFSKMGSEGLTGFLC